MKVIQNDIENIISRQLIEGLTSHEQLILDDWRAQSPENEKEYQDYLKLWNESKKLVLSDSIDVEASLLQTKKRIRFKPKQRWINYLRQAAAVLFVSLTLTSIFSYFLIKNRVESNSQMVSQTVKAAYGSQIKLVLSDGTRVWLNSGSSLEFPSSFKNADSREVCLNGEGYFEVTPNKSKAFVVNTSKFDVKVYGTSFNVNAYDSYEQMTVALVEGKVGIVDDRGKQEKELVVMKPYEVARYSENQKEFILSTDKSIEKYTAWKDGRLIFHGDPIDALARRLEKWYNVKIVVADPELKNYRFTATFIDESLDHVLQLLSLSSPLQFDVTPSKKLPDNSYSIRQVTLSIKK